MSNSTVSSNPSIFSNPTVSSIDTSSSSSTISQTTLILICVFAGLFVICNIILSVFTYKLTGSIGNTILVLIFGIFYFVYLYTSNRYKFIKK
jgi:hypothetical protein